MKGNLHSRHSLSPGMAYNWPVHGLHVLQVASGTLPSGPPVTTNGFCGWREEERYQHVNIYIYICKWLSDRFVVCGVVFRVVFNRSEGRFHQLPSLNIWRMGLNCPELSFFLFTCCTRSKHVKAVSFQSQSVEQRITSLNLRCGTWLALLRSLSRNPHCKETRAQDGHNRLAENRFTGNRFTCSCKKLMSLKLISNKKLFA